MSHAPNFRLDGKVALVTGASQGLGREIALALADSGAKVAIVARTPQLLRGVEQEAQATGATVLGFTADVTNIAEHDGLVASATGALGPIDILVNNAGTNIQQDAVDVDPESWDAIFDVNLRAAFFLCQAVGRDMIAHERAGRIINIASQMAEVGFYKRAAYAASKAGLVQMSRVLAIEWAPHRIRVNCVGPTFTDSPLARTVLADEAFRSEVMSRIPIGRLGTPEEVAAAVVYLASDSADSVTGHHLLVDGGWTAW